jgi:hypothetical protein
VLVVDDDDTSNTDDFRYYTDSNRIFCNSLYSPSTSSTAALSTGAMAGVIIGSIIGMDMILLLL